MGTRLFMVLLLASCAGPGASSTTAPTATATTTEPQACDCAAVVTYEVVPEFDGDLWCRLHELADDETLLTIAEEAPTGEPWGERWSYDGWRWEVRDREVGYQDSGGCDLVRYRVTVAVHR